MDINQQLAQYLSDNDLLDYSLTGGNTFIERMPSKPDIAFAILTGTPGSSNAKIGYDEVGVQIIIRGDENPTTAKEKAQAIYDFLNGFTSGYFVSGKDYIVLCFAEQAGPIRLGQDENNRFEYSLNFSVGYVNKTIHRE